MMKRNKKPLFISAIYMLATVLLLVSPVSMAESKNILLIMVDDMNDWIGPYGGHPQAQTPNMDAFAKDALVFKNTYCPAPLCLPSRAAMLTGLSPDTTGLHDFSKDHFRKIKNGRFKDVVTMPQHFRKNGYLAMKDGKIFHEGIKSADPVSWNEFKTHMGTRIPKNIKKASDVHGLVFKRSFHNYKYGLYWGPCVGKKLEETGDGTGAYYIIDKIKTWDKRKKPFFLAYGISKPHLPWLVPQEYFDAFPLETIQVPKLRENELEGLPRPKMSDMEQDVFDKHPEKYKEAVRAYLACLKFADDCIGRVLDTLNNSPYKDNTIICIMGDHGWHLGEKRHWGKSTLWEEAANTPLMIYDPCLGRNNGRVVEEVVSLQDLYLTLVELTQTGPAPKHVEGRSFASLVKGNNEQWQGWAVASGITDPNDHVLRTKKWSLIRYGKKGSYAYELYNMQNDQPQHHNLAEQRQWMVKELSEDMDRILNKQEPINKSLY